MYSSIHVKKSALVIYQTCTLSFTFKIFATKDERKKFTGLVINELKMKENHICSEKEVQQINNSKFNLYINCGDSVHSSRADCALSLILHHLLDFWPTTQIKESTSDRRPEGIIKLVWIIGWLVKHAKQNPFVYCSDLLCQSNTNQTVWWIINGIYLRCFIFIFIFGV